MNINRCLVISNSEEEKSSLRKKLLDVPFLNSIDFAETYSEAIKFMTQVFPDLIIIDLNCVTSHELQLLSNISFPTMPLIVLSEKPEKAAEIFDMGIAVDFIMKPFHTDRLVTALGRAIKQYISFTGARGRDFLFFKMGRIYRKFFMDEIVYFEAYGIYTKLITDSGIFTINDNISKLEERLKIYNFIRVHKSYIINSRQICSFGISHIQHTLGTIPLSKNYKHRVDGLINTFTTSHQLSHLEL